MLDRILSLPTQVRAIMFGVIAVTVSVLGWIALQPNTTSNSSQNTSHASATPNRSDGPTHAPSVVAQPNGNDAPQEVPTVGGYTDGVSLDLQMPVTDSALKSAASEAAHFTELYLSYKYDQDDAQKKTAIARLVAQDNTIDLTKIFPSGPTKAQFVTSKTTIAAKVDKIQAILISPTSLGFTITATSTTSTVSDSSTMAQNAFSLSMSYDSDRAAWFVSDFAMADGGGSFQE